MNVTRARADFLPNVEQRYLQSSITRYDGQILLESKTTGRIRQALRGLKEARDRRKGRMEILGRFGYVTDVQAKRPISC